MRDDIHSMRDALSCESLSHTHTHTHTHTHNTLVYRSTTCLTRATWGRTNRWSSWPPTSAASRWSCPQFSRQRNWGLLQFLTIVGKTEGKVYLSDWMQLTKFSPRSVPRDLFSYFFPYPQYLILPPPPLADSLDICLMGWVTWSLPFSSGVPFSCARSALTESRKCETLYTLEWSQRICFDVLIHPDKTIYTHPVMYLPTCTHTHTGAATFRFCSRVCQRSPSFVRRT